MLLKSEILIQRFAQFKNRDGIRLNEIERERLLRSCLESWI